MVNRKKSRGWIWGIGLLLAVGGVAFFSVRALSKGAPKIDAEKLAKVERIDLTRSVVATGKIEAARKVEIKSKASGIIEKLPFDLGQVVHQGELIAEAGCTGWCTGTHLHFELRHDDLPIDPTLLMLG